MSDERSIATEKDRWRFAWVLQGQAKLAYALGIVARGESTITVLVQLRDDVAQAIDRATAQTKGNFDTIVYSFLRLQNIADSMQLCRGTAWLVHAAAVGCIFRWR